MRESAAIMDLAGGRRSFVLLADNGVPIRLSASAWYLFQAVQKGLSFEAIASLLTGKGTRTVAASEIEAAYRGVAGRLRAIEARSGGDALPRGFWLRQEFLSAGLVQTLVKPLGFFFRPMVFVALLTFILLSVLAAVSAFGEARPAGYDLLLGYGLFVASLILHELGHAAACACFGARPRAIGFALYLVFPAFYSDVNTAWQLERRQRVVVDLAGIYFQMIAGAAFGVLFLATGKPLFVLALSLVLGSCLFSLNPFFRFDGYWALIDALGLTALGSRPAGEQRSLLWLDWLRGRAKRTPAPSTGSGRAWWCSWLLALYSVLGSLVGAGMVISVLSGLWVRLQGLPELMAGLGADLLAGHLPAVEQVVALLSLAFWLLLVVYLLRRLWHRFKTWTWPRRLIDGVADLPGSWNWERRYPRHG